MSASIPSQLVSIGTWPGQPVIQLRLEHSDGREELVTLEGKEPLNRLWKTLGEVLVLADEAEGGRADTNQQ